MLVEVPPVATGVHHYETHLADGEVLLCVVVVAVEADVAEPVILVLIVVVDEVRVHVSKEKDLLRGFTLYTLILQRGLLLVKLSWSSGGFFFNTTAGDFLYRD